MLSYLATVIIYSRKLIEIFYTGKIKIFHFRRNRILSPVLVRAKVFEQKVRFELLFSNQNPRAKVLVFWSYDQIGKKTILFKDVFSKTPLNGFKHWEGKIF